MYENATHILIGDIQNMSYVIIFLHWIKKSFKWGCLLLMSGVLIYLLSSWAYDIGVADRFTSFFNQNRGALFLSIKNREFKIPGGPELTVSYAKEQQMFVLHLGPVSRMLCRRLVQADIPFPHQFWLNDQRIDSLNLSLCHQSGPRYLSFQFSAALQPFAHETTADVPCQCDKPFSSFGLCTDMCLHYAGCRQTPLCNQEK